MTSLSERQRARLIYTKSKKIAKRFHIQKAGHFEKSKTICVTFLYTVRMNEMPRFQYIYYSSTIIKAI